MASTRRSCRHSSQHFVEPIKFKLVGITAEGDRVAAEFTGQAPLDNGLTLDNVYHLLFKFQDGKIIHAPSTTTPSTSTT